MAFEYSLGLYKSPISYSTLLDCHEESIWQHLGVTDLLKNCTATMNGVKHSHHKNDLHDATRFPFDSSSAYMMSDDDSVVSIPESVYRSMDYQYHKHGMGLVVPAMALSLLILFGLVWLLPVLSFLIVVALNFLLWIVLCNGQKNPRVKILAQARQTRMILLKKEARKPTSVTIKAKTTERGDDSSNNVIMKATRTAITPALSSSPLVAACCDLDDTNKNNDNDYYWTKASAGVYQYHCTGGGEGTIIHDLPKNNDDMTNDVNSRTVARGDCGGGGKVELRFSPFRRGSEDGVWKIEGKCPNGTFLILHGLVCTSTGKMYWLERHKATEPGFMYGLLPGLRRLVLVEGTFNCKTLRLNDGIWMDSSGCTGEYNVSNAQLLYHHTTDVEQKG